MAGFFERLRDGWAAFREADTYASASAAALMGAIVYLGDDPDAGIVVDRETALEIGSVFACLNCLVTDVGQVPLNTYTHTKTGRQKAWSSPAYNAFKYGPNPYQTAQDWQEQLMLHLLTAGDYYARIGRVLGKFDALYPIGDPLTVRTAVRGGRQVHTIDDVDQGELFHIHTPSVDGFQGRDFVENHQQVLSLAKALYRYGSRWFANGAQMRGILVLPASTKKEDVEGAKAAFIEAYGGDDMHKIAAYGPGTNYVPIDVDPEKSQALESRQAVNREIAALWKIPHWRLYGDDAPNLEARTSYYVDTIGPWLQRISQPVNKYLIGSDSPVYVEHNTAALLRADIATRMTAYSTAISSRIMTPNEARDRENLPRHPDGDELINPAVMSAEDRKAIEAAKAARKGGDE